MKKTIWRSALLWCTVALWMILIFWFSSQNSDQSAALSGGLVSGLFSFLEVIPACMENVVRKMAHFGLYTVLGVLTRCSCAATPRLKKPAVGISLSAGICLLYAASDEFHQSFVPGRGPQITDVLIDFSGAILGILIVSGLILLYQKRKKKKESAR